MTIKQALMTRDELTEKEADEILAEIKDRFDECIMAGDMESAYYIMDDYGLEPDYVEELIY